MQFVEADTSHIFIIRLLAERIWPATFSPILSSNQIAYMMEMMYSVESLTKQITEDKHCFLLAKDGDEYVGYTSYESNYKSQPQTKIHKIYILPAIQNKGIGRFLIESVTNKAILKKNTNLTLNVNRYNEAIKFYQHIGFEISGEENINIGDGFLMEDYILTKSIL